MHLWKAQQKKTKDASLEEILKELKWVLHQARQYKKEMALYLVLQLFAMAMSYGGSILGKYIIDAVTQKETDKILPFALFYILFLLCNLLTDAVLSRVTAKTNIRVALSMRAEMYDKIMQADWEKMSAYHSGDLLNRMEGDIQTVSAAVLGWLPKCFTAAIGFLGAFGIVFYYDRVLALISLCTAPVTLLISRVTMRKMRAYIQKSKEISSKVTIFNEESFNNLLTIKSFGLLDYYAKKLREIQKLYQETALHYNKFNIITTSILSATAALVSAFCFGWGVLRLWEGAITFGTMTLFLQMAGVLSSTFSELVHMVPSALAAATCAGRILAVSELPKENYDKEPMAKVFLEKHKKEPLTLKAEHLSFAYGKNDAVLSDCGFTAKSGEITALIGASGTGKTTMLRLLLGIVQKKEGKLQVVSNKQESFDLCPSTRQFFSYVPQKNTMFFGTVAENLRAVKNDATEAEMQEALRLACAEEFIKEAPQGMDTPILENGVGFSEGQIQRISIARALLADTPILLLDEATSALDAETAERVLQNIVQSNRHKICIVTTHRSRIVNACDTVYKISNHSIEKIK